MGEDKIVYSVFTKTWNSLSLEELARLFKGMGFDGVELPVRPDAQVKPENVATDLPKAASILADYGLKICSVAGPTDDVAIATYAEAIIATCAEVGRPYVRINVKIQEDGYMATEARWQRKIEGLLPLLEKYNVKLAIQNHVGRCVCNAMGLRHLIERFDPQYVGAVWDSGHSGLCGEEPEMGLDMVWSHLCAVNLKNAFWERINGPEASFAQWKHHLTTGQHGLTSWPRTVAELKRRGYKGVVCIPVEYDDRSVANANRLTPQDLALAKSLFAGGQ